MIELLNGVILGKGCPKEEVSFSLEKGTINYIPYEERYKFNFLMLKNQSLDKGTFKINDVQIYPDESNESSLFFLSVNSLIRIHLCFLVKKDEKKAKVKFTQDELVKLRDLPVETDEDKNNKIVAILNRVEELAPAYALFDLNDFTNEYGIFAINELEKHAQNINIVVLEKKAEEALPIEAMQSNVTLDIGDEMVEQPKTKKEKAPSNGFFKEFAQIFKEDISAFGALVVPTISVLLFSMLSPLYAQTNKVLLIPFILAMIIGFVLFCIMIYRFAEFKNKEQLISFIILTTGSVGLGAGASVGIYFLFLTFDQEIKALQSKNVTGIVVTIILALLLVTSSLYIPPLVNLVKKLFKKK